MMYSSGTTGRPKGVMLSHRNIVAHTQNVVPVAPMGPGDRNLVAMPLFHVGGTCYALFGIYAGVPSTFTREPDPASLLAAFAAGATYAFLVPAVVSALLAAGERAIAAMGGLKYLLYGAAPMPLPVLRQALAAWPGLNFVQVYGLTELAGVISALSPQAHRDAAREDRLGSARLVPCWSARGDAGGGPGHRPGRRRASGCRVARNPASWPGPASTLLRDASRSATRGRRSPAHASPNVPRNPAAGVFPGSVPAGPAGSRCRTPLIPDRSGPRGTGTGR